MKNQETPKEETQDWDFTQFRIFQKALARHVEATAELQTALLQYEVNLPLKIGVKNV